MLHKFIHKSSPMNSGSDQRIRAIKKNFYKQALLMVAVVMVLVILIFAMTTAWFTNIVSTSDLIFQAESWGFEGTVSVPNTPITAAPGDSGVVCLQVNNESDTANTITVNISKAFMDRELQKRVFFYAEQPVARNGEMVQRQYLTDTGGYAYSLFPWNALILDEQLHTDVQLKWEWVYDVVGYYFRESPDETKFEAVEYLRPVEYDFDQARYDQQGNLLMVDAQTDVADFLAALTAADGYAGAYRVTQDAQTGKKQLVDETGAAVQTYQGCYPIDEDNGIWLYLCTEADIVANTKWDTAFGAAANDASASFQARITVIGQQMMQMTQQESDPVAIQNAINAGSGAVIQLSQDVALSEPLTLQPGVQAILDMNGNQLTFTGETAFAVESGARLTVYNGAIRGDNAKAIAFSSLGGQITLNNVQVTDIYTGVQIKDHLTTSERGDNSIVRITNSTLTSKNVTVMVSGDGNASEGKTVVLVQDSTLTSTTYAGISGNGTATNPGRWGTEIQVINSTVTGRYCGIYHPQMRSDLTVSGSTVSGMSGMAVKGGNVTIIDSKILGTGEADVVDPETTTPNKSGFLDTGDGVYIESDYGYPVVLKISGACEISHKAATAKAVRVYPEATHVRTLITGGQFDSDVTQYLADGYVCTENEGRYTVTEVTAQN